MMSFGPALVMVAIGAGSAIEVGLIGGYSEEDMREWRASLGAVFLMIGTLWTLLCVLSIYGPLLLVVGRELGGLGGGGRVGGHFVLGRTGGPERKDRWRQDQQEPTQVRRHDRAAGVPDRPGRRGLGAGGRPARGGHLRQGRGHVPPATVPASGPEITWTVMLASAYMWVVGCVHANINLFGLNAFYANRLVRCYLGRRGRGSAQEGRPNFAPTNSPGPVRRPNPITGFDRDDDFPLHDLAIVRSWDGDDLVVNYRGPYHLINTAMNLGAGSELAWQERKAESFILSPLYCGSKTTGYRRATIVKSDLEDDEVEPEERKPETRTLWPAMATTSDWARPSVSRARRPAPTRATTRRRWPGS